MNDDVLERILRLFYAVSGFDEAALGEYGDLVTAVLHRATAPQDENEVSSFVAQQAMKLYYIMTLAAGDGDVTEFKAGDVTVKEAHSRLEQAKEMLDTVAAADGAPQDSGFAFRTV